ncbi:class F sortase [Streptomyces sp. SID3343]|uniref:class F sortase n=1 Tax=Streptomyces sp. SID3343 TaxID=2690260 RepID=UPI00136F4C0F|nr:class F sortase [Streptomyces sp. SID3343]MYW02455.1 class F sortase [Streptomyces sp. SID3343]
MAFWATVLAVAAGIWLVVHGAGGGAVERPPDPFDAGLASAAARSRAEDGRRIDAPPLPPSPPTRIRIPAIRVDAPMDGLDKGLDNRLNSPPVANANVVGWYRGGVAPGAQGNAVTVGHADTRTGPAVFFKLGLLRAGDRIEVLRRDRHKAIFTIDAVRSYDKNAFPDDAVYGQTHAAELRVITCGGQYDKHTGYAANVVVFAHLTETR